MIIIIVIYYIVHHSVVDDDDDWKLLGEERADPLTMDRPTLVASSTAAGSS